MEDILNINKEVVLAAVQENDEVLEYTPVKIKIIK